MRKIEKETLEIINNYKGEEYSHYKKLITIRENELRENLDKQLYNIINKAKIESDIENFKSQFNFKISVNFELSIRTYYTDYNSLYTDDKDIQNCKEHINKIEKERNKMILILQNSDIKGEEYKTVIKKLKGE